MSAGAVHARHVFHMLAIDETGRFITIIIIIIIIVIIIISSSSSSSIITIIIVVISISISIIIITAICPVALSNLQLRRDAPASKRA
jgi:hypothetical protein